jgi:hypothetical protein
MCGVKTCATMDKENVRKVFLKIKQHEKEWQSAKHGKLTGHKFVFSFEKKKEKTS